MLERVTFNNLFSNSIYRLPRVDDLKEQVYEVDTDIEQGDLVRLFGFWYTVFLNIFPHY